MPIYEYRCTSCGHELEVLQKLSEAPLTNCPACEKSALTKLVSAAGFQLKGSGWYATDFKSNGKPASKPDAKGGDAKGGDAKGGDAKGGDAKGGDAKSGEAKSGDTKSESTSATPGATSCGSNCACH